MDQDDDFKSNVIYVAIALLVAGTCIYGMIEPLHTKATTETREYLSNPDKKSGPFDEAMEESLKRLGS